SEDRFRGIARELASGRTLDADRPSHVRIRGQDRRSDRVDAAMDRQGRVHQAERGGAQTVLRASLHRRKLWPPGLAAWKAGGRARLCEGRGPDPRTIDNVKGG